MPLYRAELIAKKPLQTGALIHDLSQVLHLPFDYDDGSYARDRSGYNNHGTIYGATLVDGKIGMARRFDGTDDEVDMGDVLDMGTIDFTLTAWIKTTATVDQVAIITKDWAGQPRWYIGMVAGGEFRAYISDNITTRYGDSAPGFNDGIFHHVAAVFDRDAKCTIYVDGSVSGTPFDISAVGNVDNPAPLLVGHNPRLHHWWDGIIDEPRILTRILSKDEIRLLMYRRL